MGPIIISSNFNRIGEDVNSFINNELQNSSCDCCGTHSCVSNYDRVPMIFTTEQTGGSETNPYFCLEDDMFLCDNCADLIRTQYKTISKLSNTPFITVSGAMGRNDILTNNRLFYSFKTHGFSEEKSDDEIMLKVTQSDKYRAHWSIYVPLYPPHE